VKSGLALLATLLPAVSHAGGFGIPEIGVRRTAMSTVIGRPDDPSAIYHNPAGLALQPGFQLYVSMGLSLLDTEFRLRPWSDTITSDGTTRSSDDFLGAMPDGEGYYGAVKPTRAMGVIPMIAATYEAIPGKLWLGAGVYVGSATGARFADDAVTRYHLLDGYIVAPQAVLSAAYQVTPTLALGVTAGVINMHVKGKRFFYPVIRQGENTTDISSIVGRSPLLELEGEAWAPTYVLGAFGKPHPRVTWGATITGRTDAKLEGPVEVTYSEDVGTEVLIGTQTTTQLLPWAFMGGANFDVTPNVEIGTEFRYWLYRQYKEQRTEVTGIFLVRELVTTKNYEDSWEASAGVRVHDLAAVPGLELMAGFNWDKSPAPARTVTLDQPSFTHFGLHNGARYSFGRYRIGASYIFYHYFVPTIEDSITAPPSNIRGRGTNNIFTASLEVKL